MTSTRPTRQHGIPTWLLVAIALAGIVGLLLTEPTSATGATLEDFPPPLPLDELPATGPDGVAIAANIAAVVLLAGAILYGLFALRDVSAFAAWIRGGHEAVAHLHDERHVADLERHGFLVYTCPSCGGHAWSRQPDATLDSLRKLHHTIAPARPCV